MSPVDDALLAQLARTGIPIHRDVATRAEASRDFGRCVLGDSALVAQPRDADEVEAFLALANARGLRVTVRGKGYSQSGQSVAAGGATLDLRRLDRIHRVDASSRTARVEAGATWRQLLARTLEHGLAPHVVPANLDMTVGGLLSAGGIGTSSVRHGPVVANVEAVELVSGAGERLRSARGDPRGARDAVLAGLGRCAVITEVELALRPVAPTVRAITLLYDRLDAWLADQAQLVGDPRYHHLESAAWAGFKGVRRGRPFADWSFSVHIGIEHGAEQHDLLGSLSSARVLSEEDVPIGAWYGRFEPRFSQMVRTGAWQEAHPWFEVLLPADRAGLLLEQIVPDLPLSLGDGHRLIWVASAGAPPLFAMPAGSHALCFAILPTAVAASERSGLLHVLGELDRRLGDAGAKRYLSGWLGPMPEERWAAHLGPAYAGWLEHKRALDPNGILTSALFTG